MGILEDIEEMLSIRMERVERLTGSGRGGKQEAPRWVPPGERITIHGYDIHGFVYVGTGICSDPYYSFLYYDSPSLIDTDLSVGIPGESHIEGYYHLTYSSLSQCQRANYLEWLANGRTDPDIDISYVFIFFYGLERRILTESGRDLLSFEEVGKIRNEVRRLLELYGVERSYFKDYSRRFLLFIEARYDLVKFYERPFDASCYWPDIPIPVRLAIGQLALEGKELSWEWLYLYGKTNPLIPKKRSFRKCETELKVLFESRLKKMYPEGIKMKPNKRKVRISYRPAASGIYEVFEKTDIPDICLLKGLQRKIAPLFGAIQEELYEFIKWVARNSIESAYSRLDVISMLPKDYLSTLDNKVLNDYEEWILEQSKGKKIFLLTQEELLRLWPVKNNQKFSKRESIDFICLMEKLGYGIEPDIREPGGTFKPGCPIACFRQNEKVDKSENGYFCIVSTFIYVFMYITGRDDCMEEEKRIMEFVEIVPKLTNEEKTRLKARTMWLARSTVSTRQIKDKITVLSAGQKDTLIYYILSFARINGKITSEKIKKLVKVYGCMGFDEMKLYSDIQKNASRSQPEEALGIDKKRDTYNGLRSREDIPVIMSGSAREGFAIPSAPGDMLDQEKVLRVLEDTKDVSSLLEKIFDDSDDNSGGKEEKDCSAEIAGLDTLHTRLLMSLGKNQTISREQFGRLCGEMGLLPDAALDRLNEFSIEGYDAELCWGDDPIEIDLELYKEINNEG